MATLAHAIGLLREQKTKPAGREELGLVSEIDRLSEKLFKCPAPLSLSETIESLGRRYEAVGKLAKIRARQEGFFSKFDDAIDKFNGLIILAKVFGDDMLAKHQDYPLLLEQRKELARGLRDIFSKMLADDRPKNEASHTTTCIVDTTIDMLIRQDFAKAEANIRSHYGDSLETLAGRILIAP